ncbi:lipoyl(octanoyl) transferase LipB [Streptosporangiaceae bacterium NEAU-GS5]|nr:lipoyl(octanoyl) transferase LipB [Streptosporangiaceae bacterium NEAU-GS5]
MSELALVRLGVDVPYEQAWALQRKAHAKRVSGSIPDILLTLEHAPVYTAGKRTQPDERPQDGTPVIDVDRGGKITWHGPGQLVGYPIIAIGDATAYVRLLEGVLVQICADFGVVASRIEGRPGVWVRNLLGRPARMIGAIGVRVTQGVTTHGFSLNCANDLRWYDRIVPCGIRGAAVTSLSVETGRRITAEEVTPFAEKRLVEALEAQPRDMYEEDLA